MGHRPIGDLTRHDLSYTVEGMRFQNLHRYIRAMTKHYPSRHPAQQFSALMGYLFPQQERLWMVSAPCGLAPMLELNLQHPYQRKIFCFPKAWGNYWMRQPFQRFFKQELIPNTMFIDIGAHLGFFSFHVAKLIGPGGSVIAFEPDPDMYESLFRSTRLNSSYCITCANIALSDVNGQAKFYRSRDSTASSLVPEKPGHEDRYRDSIPVQCRRLDDYVKEHDLNLQKLHLVKCDVEGHEDKVVSGMLNSLIEASFPTIWIEVRGPEGSTRAPNTYRDVNRMLNELGYKPYFWVEGKYIPVSDGDVIDRRDVVFRHEPPVSVST